MLVIADGRAKTPTLKRRVRPASMVAKPRPNHERFAHPRYKTKPEESNKKTFSPQPSPQRGRWLPWKDRVHDSQPSLTEKDQYDCDDGANQNYIEICSMVILMDGVFVFLYLCICNCVFVFVFLYFCSHQSTLMMSGPWTSCDVKMPLEVLSVYLLIFTLIETCNLTS